MEFLKEIFQDRALTYEAFQAALAADGRMRLVDVNAEAAEKKDLQAVLQELEERRAEVMSLRQQFDEAQKAAAVDLAIVQAGGRNVKAIRALLDLSEVQLAEDGTLQGFQLEDLKRSDGYLFEAEESQRLGTGFQSGRFSDWERMKQDFEEAVWVR